jgi:hypothetical protein
MHGLRRKAKKRVYAFPEANGGGVEVRLIGFRIAE